MGILLIIALITVGICPAQGANMELISHLGGNNYDIAIAGNYAYLGQGQDLVVLNITDDTKPLEVGRVTTPSMVYGVTVSGDTAYVANENSGLTIINISKVFLPQITGNKTIDGITYDVMLSGNNACVIGSNGLSIIDVSNSSSPVLVSTYGTDEIAASTYQKTTHT